MPKIERENKIKQPLCGKEGGIELVWICVITGILGAGVVTYFVRYVLKRKVIKVGAEQPKL